MNFLLTFLVVISFALLSMGIVQNVEARGADEPCSYLKPHEWTRDSAGNCVRISSVPVTSSTPVTGRSVHEPCSYLNPTKYVRDSSGLCHEVIMQVPTPIKTAPPVASASIYSVNTDPTISPINPSTDDAPDITIVYSLALAAFFGILGYKLWKRTKKPTIQNRDIDFDQRWHNVNRRTHNFDQRVHNVQTRFLQLRDEDPDLFLHEINAKLIKYSKRGNELYEARYILPDNQKLKILKYRDPSTGRIYISFVPEHLNDPDEAMAWKFRITKQQYHNLVDEG